LGATRLLRWAGCFAIHRGLSSRRGVRFVDLEFPPEMPKMKSKRAAAKRFSFTGTGKVKRSSANHRHNMTHKAQKVKVGQRGSKILEAGDAALVRLMLPYG
jgi:large subunit ribosomal protein L35